MRTGRADSRRWSRAASALDPKTAALLQVGASVAIGSPAVCLERSASRALAVDASEDEIADVLLAIAPVALRAQPVHQPGRAGRGRAAHDAGRKRHLPRLDPRRGPGQGRPRLLRPPAEGLEFVRPDRGDDPLRHGRLRRPCGWALARAHARSGDRIALAAYLNGSGAFDQAIADFAETYADQNERDYAALQAAVKDGKAEATTEI